jgi:hypothetical protein
MWCPHCKSETSATGKLFTAGQACANCGRTLSGSSSSENTIRQARDIIAKWSQSDLLDQISALPSIPPMPRPHFAAAAVTLPEPEKPEPETKAENSTLELPKTEAAIVVIEPELGTPSEVTREAIPETETETIIEANVASGIHFEFETGEPEKLMPLSEASEDLQPPESIQDIAAETAEPVIEASTNDETYDSSHTETTQEFARRDPDSEFTNLRPPAVDQVSTVSAYEEEQAGNNPRIPEVIASIISVPAITKSVGTDSQTDDSGQSDHADFATAEKNEPTSRPRTLRERATQHRTSQPRPERERKLSAEAEHKGSNPVSRKFRVDTPGGEHDQPVDDGKVNAAGGRIQSNSQTGGRRHRIDSGEPVAETLSTSNDRVRTQNRPRQRYVDDAHEDAIRGPHFQVTAPKRTNLTSMTGHVLAYLGVLGLTVGTAMVICGHFMGYSDYTPTGWLVTTVAQMMLFLGLINLVSGGMDQTNEDVSARINTLGEQLLRIEQVTEEALRGPKISARRYMDPDAELEESERETAGRVK